MQNKPIKVAIDISPLQTGHSVRGVGYYVENLQKALVKYGTNEYVFFTKTEQIPKDADIVHYTYFDPFYINLPKNSNAKTIVTVHDLIPIIFPSHFPAGVKGKIKWQIQKRRLRKINHVITVSNCSKNDVNKYTGIKEENISVIYLSAAEQFRRNKEGKWIAEIRNKYNLPENFVLYVGDATWNKNLPQLINAVVKLDIPLVLVGKSLTQKNIDIKNLWNRDLLLSQALIKENKNLHSFGYVETEDLVKIYNLATLFIMPSYYEGFGLPVLEALNCGCPVICSKKGSLPEIAGDAALYVDPDDIDNILESIKRLYSNKNLQNQLRDKGFKQAHKFSWEKTAQQTILVYQKLINDK